MIFRKHGEID